MKNEFIMEARNSDGSLNVKGETPFMVCTEDQIYDHFFNRNPKKMGASLEEVTKWYNDRGWYWRPKTW